MSARVLVLGAGPLQLPLIHAAHRVGLEAVTLDNVPGNVGHRHSDASVHASTRDADAVLRAARDFAVDGIVTCCTDVALPAWIEACRALGLPGPPPSLREAWFPKHALRRFQREAGIDAPGCVAGSVAEPLAADAAQLTGPLVVKPVDRSGSRGVSFVESAADPRLRAAIETARAQSFAGLACVEQRIPGKEYGGDAIVIDGRVAAVFATEKRMEGSVVRGHAMPSGLTERAAESLRATLQAHVSAVGYAAGAVNFDAMIDAEPRARLIELAPRLGGNWIPQLAKACWGVDLFGCAIELALGRPVTLRPRSRPDSAGSFVLGAPSAGVLQRKPTRAEVQERVPELIAWEIDVELGDRVAPIRHSGQQLGRALFTLGSRSFDEIARVLDRLVVRAIR